MKKQPFDFRTIDSFEAACKATGIDPDSINLPGLPDHVLAYWQLTIVTQAINNDQIWSADRLVWIPLFFYYYGASAGLADSHASHAPSDAYANFGGRICFETEEKSDYAANQFLDIYKRYLFVQ